MRPTRVPLLLAAACLVSCGGSDATGPNTPTAASVRISSGNNQNATVASALPIAPTVLVEDRAGSAVPGVTVTFAVQSGGGSVTGGAVTTDANGLAAVGSWTLGTAAGANTLTATVSGVTPVSFSATAMAGPATVLALATPPSGSAGSGVLLPVQPVVQLRDAYGNGATQANVPVTVTISTGGGTLAGTTTVNSDANGRAAFSDLSISGVVGPRTLTFSASGLTPVLSGAMSLVAGTPATVVATTATAQNGTAGLAVGARPTVLVSDASTNPVPGVSVTFAMTVGGGTVTGASATTNASGLATVGSWTLGQVAGPNALTASVAGIAAVPFTASGNPGLPSDLVIINMPAAGQSGVVLSPAPAVQLTDAFGNPVNQSGLAITVALAIGGGNLAGSLTIGTDASGQATFSNLVITGAIGNRALTFSGSGITAATSSLFNLAAGSPTTIASHSAISQNGTVAAQVGSPPSVLVTDASGNPVSGVGVTFAVATGGGSLVGAGATTNVNGIARVTSWTLGTVAGPNSLTATATGLVGSPVNFTATAAAGAPAALVISTQPSDAVNGAPIPTQPVVALQDGFGNASSQAGVSVTAAIGSGGGTLSGTVTLNTDASGTASFTDLVLVGLVGSRTLKFSSSGLAGATSTAFNLSVGAAAALEMVTQPSTSATSGSQFAQQPTVRLVDAGGNPVSQAGVAVTVSRSPAGAGLGGTHTVATDGSGVATFTDLALTGSVGAYRLGFASGSLSRVFSGTIDLVAGPAAQITALSITAQSAGVGTNVANPPSVQVTDLSGNPVSGAAVTFSVTQGGGTVNPSSAVSTDATGIATLANWTLGRSAGTNTVNASVPLVATTINFNATSTFQVAAVSGGQLHTCALTVDGVAYCWGDNSSGALGDSTLANRLIPTAVAGGLTFSSVSSGNAFSCGLRSSGAAYCWGSNTAGNLGNGGVAIDSAPHPVSGGHSFTTLVTGLGSGRITCGIDTGMAAWCWGADGMGQLGNGAPLAKSLTPALVSGGFLWQGLGVRSTSTCGVRTTNAAYCWGSDAFGQLGDGAPKANVDHPVAVIGGLSFSQVAPGQVSACALTVGGAAYCWGSNLNGRLGVDPVTTTESLTPIAVTGGLAFTQLVAGDSFTCGLTAGGAAYCWGFNGTGQLGDGTTNEEFTPTPVSGGHSFTTIAAGSSHACGRTSLGQLYCWGDNSSGQIGDGTINEADSPVLVAQP
jgi:alpha-tubulin suppressor-like RCC1 family protein